MGTQAIVQHQDKILLIIDNEYFFLHTNRAPPAGKISPRNAGKASDASRLVAMAEMPYMLVTVLRRRIGRATAVSQPTPSFS